MRRGGRVDEDKEDIRGVRYEEEEQREGKKRGGRVGGLLKVRSLISHCGSRH